MSEQQDCSVLQDWVIDLKNWKKQTVLMECIRAPDVPISKEMKSLFTFLRSVVLRNADPTTDFMKDAKVPTYLDIEREFERLPLHCAHHILMTLEIIGYEHPDQDTQAPCWMFYCDAVNAQHLHIEGRAEYEARMNRKKKYATNVEQQHDSSIEIDRPLTRKSKLSFIMEIPQTFKPAAFQGANIKDDLIVSYWFDDTEYTTKAQIR